MPVASCSTQQSKIHINFSMKQRRGIPFGAATSYVHLEKLCEGSCATVYKGISRWASTTGAIIAFPVPAENTPYRNPEECAWNWAIQSTYRKIKANQNPSFVFSQDIHKAPSRFFRELPHYSHGGSTKTLCSTSACHEIVCTSEGVRVFLGMRDCCMMAKLEVRPCCRHMGAGKLWEGRVGTLPKAML